MMAEKYEQHDHRVWRDYHFFESVSRLIHIPMQSINVTIVLLVFIDDFNRDFNRDFNSDSSGDQTQQCLAQLWQPSTYADHHSQRVCEVHAGIGSTHSIMDYVSMVVMVLTSVVLIGGLVYMCDDLLYVPDIDGDFDDDRVSIDHHARRDYGNPTITIDNV